MKSKDKSHLSSSVEEDPFIRDDQATRETNPREFDAHARDNRMDGSKSSRIRTWVSLVLIDKRNELGRVSHRDGFDNGTTDRTSVGRFDSSQLPRG